MKTTKSFVTCQVRLSGARKDKLQEILSIWPKCIRFIGKPKIVAGAANRFTLIADVEYGPSWGGWESDIRRAIHRAIKKTGSTARLDFVNLNRRIIEERKSA